MYTEKKADQVSPKLEKLWYRYICMKDQPPSKGVQRIGDQFKFFELKELHTYSVQEIVSHS